MVMTMDGNIYLLQYGSYISKEVMEESIKNLSYYLIQEVDDKYYVYLGATTDYLIAHRLQEYLENNNLYTYIKNDYLYDSDILDQIKEKEKKLEKDISPLVIKEILEILKSVHN